ncbi:MAG: hypothetical protein LH630_07925, partial [Actinomycetia bacterium]|nr:hypothetical protein [Actinomycetes bacterium]
VHDAHRISLTIRSEASAGIVVDGQFVVLVRSEVPNGDRRPDLVPPRPAADTAAVAAPRPTGCSA